MSYENPLNVDLMQSALPDSMAASSTTVDDMMMDELLNFGCMEQLRTSPSEISFRQATSSLSTPISLREDRSDTSLVDNLVVVRPIAHPGSVPQTHSGMMQTPDRASAFELESVPTSDVALQSVPTTPHWARPIAPLSVSLHDTTALPANGQPYGLASAIASEATVQTPDSKGHTPMSSIPGNEDWLNQFLSQLQPRNHHHHHQQQQGQQQQQQLQQDRPQMLLQLLQLHAQLTSPSNGTGDTYAEWQYQQRQEQQWNEHQLQQIQQQQQVRQSQWQVQHELQGLEQAQHQMQHLQSLHHHELAQQQHLYKVAEQHHQLQLAQQYQQYQQQLAQLNGSTPPPRTPRSHVSAPVLPTQSPAFHEQTPTDTSSLSHHRLPSNGVLFSPDDVRSTNSGPLLAAVSPALSPKLPCQTHTSTPYPSIGIPLPSLGYHPGMDVAASMQTPRLVTAKPRRRRKHPAATPPRCRQRARIKELTEFERMKRRNVARAAAKTRRAKEVARTQKVGVMLDLDVVRYDRLAREETALRLQLQSLHQELSEAPPPSVAALVTSLLEKKTP